MVVLLPNLEYGSWQLFALLVVSCSDAATIPKLRREPHRQPQNCPSSNASVNSISDLASQYCNIFTTGNRNAASFRWFNFLMSKTHTLTPSSFEELNKGYCPISGSPIGGTNKARVSLKTVSGGTETGSFHFCCDPCLCDMVDMVRVDTKTIHVGTDNSQYKVLVHGDPCKNEEQLKEAFTDPFSGSSVKLAAVAPEVTCEDGSLKGAQKSDAGHPIIGLFFADPGTTPSATAACAKRASGGYQSGMGLIFRKVAEITPIN